MAARSAIDLERRRKEHEERVSKWRSLSKAQQVASLIKRPGESKHQMARIHGVEVKDGK